MPGEEMRKALQAFISAGNALLDVWDHDQVHQYPAYMPSFDEFLMQFGELLVSEDEVMDKAVDLAAARGDICNERLTSGPMTGGSCDAWRGHTGHLEGCKYYREDNSINWTEPPPHCEHCKGALVTNATGDLACSNKDCFYNDPGAKPPK